MAVNSFGRDLYNVNHRYQMILEAQKGPNSIQFFSYLSVLMYVLCA